MHGVKSKQKIGEEALIPFGVCDRKRLPLPRVVIGAALTLLSIPEVEHHLLDQEETPQIHGRDASFSGLQQQRGPW